MVEGVFDTPPPVVGQMAISNHLFTSILDNSLTHWHKESVRIEAMALKRSAKICHIRS